MRLSCRVQTVERFGRDVESRDKAEGKFGAGQIVIDRFGYATDRNVKLMKLGRDGKRSLPTQNYEGINAEYFHVTQRLFVDTHRSGRGAVWCSLNESTPIARTQDRAAAR